MSLLERLRNAVPGLTRLSRTRGAQALLRPLMRSAVIDRGCKLQLLEWLGPAGRVESYTLRASDVRIVIRHGTRDVDIVDEVFVGVPCYRPPREVVELLAAVAQPRVLDLGANIGLFGAYMLSRYPRATITSFEPDPWNFQVLARCVMLNRAGSSWTPIEKCVGVADGEARLAAGRYADSHVTEVAEDSAIDVACVDVFPHLDDSHLVKMDIEGSEWPILSDPRLALATCPAVVVEWHERGAPDEDAFAAAVRLLREAGFDTAGERGRDSHGVLWGWRAAADVS